MAEKKPHCLTCDRGEPQVQFYPYKTFICKRCHCQATNKYDKARSPQQREARRQELLEKRLAKPVPVDDFPAGFVRVERLTVPVDNHCPLLRQFGRAMAHG